MVKEKHNFTIEKQKSFIYKKEYALYVFVKFICSVFLSFKSTFMYVDLINKFSRNRFNSMFFDE